MTTTELLATPIVAVALVTATASPFFWWCDRRATRRRFEKARATVTSVSHEHLENVCAHFLDDICRGVRNRHSDHEALSLAVHRHQDLAHWLAPVVVAHSESTRWGDAVAVLDPRAPAPLRRTIAHVVLSSAGGVIHPPAVERAAALMRRAGAARDEAAAQSAHIRLSLRALTWIPVVVVVGSLALHSDARSALTSSSSLVFVLVLALTLNLLGRTWMNRLVRQIL